MELSQIPAALQSRLRLSVIAALLSGPKKFRTLQDLTGATAGNLGKQLEQLEEEGYLDSKKEFVGRRPNTNGLFAQDCAPAMERGFIQVDAGPIPPIVCSPMGGSNLPSMWPCWNLFWPRQRRRSQRRKSCRSETSLRQLFWFAVKPSVGRGPRCVRSR